MPPLSFLLEQGQGLSSPYCSAAPGSTTEMSTSSPIHQCAICIQPLPVPVTHACWRISCLQRTKKKPVKSSWDWKSHGEQATGHLTDAPPLLP